MLLVSSDDAVSQANTTQESLYDRGRRHYRAGEMDKAERSFIEHLKHDLSHSKSYEYLMRVYKDQGKGDALMELCRNILEVGNNLRGMDIEAVRRQYADLCYSRKNYEDALYHYLILIKQNHSDFELEKRVAFLYASQGRWDKSLSMLQHIVAQDPLDHEAQALIVPPLIAKGNKEQALKNLKELESRGKLARRERFVYGSLLSDMGDEEAALKEFLSYLEEGQWTEDAANERALSYVLKQYYRMDGPFKVEEASEWMEILEKGVNVVASKSSKKLELMWQLGFMAFFAGYSEAETSQSLQYFNSVFSMDPDYKKVSLLIDKINEFTSGDFQVLQDTFREEKGTLDRVFTNPSGMDPSTFYKIPPFDPTAIEDALNRPLIGSFKAFFKGEKVSLDSIQTMSNQMFELRMAQVFKKMGFEITKTLSRDRQKSMSSFLVESKEKGKMVCATYKDTRDMGEVELINVKESMTSESVERGMVISLGSFTGSASDFATKSNIVLMSGSQLMDSGYL